MDCVSLDADHLGHLFVVVDKYHNWVNKQLERAELSTRDYGAEKYDIGYMQGRLELGMLTAKDVEVIEGWESKIE